MHHAHARAHRPSGREFGSWTCTACTFEHTGPAADFLQCCVCLAQRPLSSSGTTTGMTTPEACPAPTTDIVTNKKKRPLCRTIHPPPRVSPVSPLSSPLSCRPGRSALPSRSMSRRPTLVIFDLDRTLWDGDIRQLDPQGEGSIHATKQTSEGLATAIRDSRGVELRVFANAVAAVKQ